MSSPWDVPVGTGGIVRSKAVRAKQNTKDSDPAWSDILAELRSIHEEIAELRDRVERAESHFRPIG